MIYAQPIDIYPKPRVKGRRGSVPSYFEPEIRSRVNRRGVPIEDVGVRIKGNRIQVDLSTTRLVFPVTVEEIHSIPIDEVSLKILANALSGNAVSQSSLLELVVQKFARGEYKEELLVNSSDY